MKNDREIVLKAIFQDGLILQFASDSLKLDQDIVCKAVKRNKEILSYI